ncbi:maltose/maltodextrin transporter ATP-binding protein [Citrobacter koseri]|uniref:Maltose/maltodextrin transporter ATP-binding protein n=1 Tax=Citrobacter koseri TaxID=545 RepID=A0A2X2W057_CITKO|nr:maltose/maltodextrin transporter ATP-binding protein [Citrobacter koseri]
MPARVAQVGKPLELYHYPADRFVAGFIGSPKMNFLPVKVTATAIEQVQVELPNRQNVWLPVESNGVQVGANMSLGIRPEHLLPATSPMSPWKARFRSSNNLVTKHKFISRSPPFVKTWFTARTTWCW